MDDEENLPEEDDDNNLPDQNDVIDLRTEIANKAREKRDAENAEHASEIAELEELHGIKPEPDSDDNTDIVVNGEKASVPVDEILQAGKVALQMEKSSQERYKEAARMRDEYERKLSDLNKPEEPPAKIVQEEPQVDLDLSEKEFVDTMMYGENEDNLRKIYQKIQNSNSTDDNESKIDERIANAEQVKFQQRYEADRVSGNEAFKRDFPEINTPGNDYMHDIAFGEAQRLQAQYPNESPSRILHQAGLNTRQRVMDLIGIGAEQTVDDKTKLKQSLPSQTKHASVRRPSKNNEKSPSKASIVSDMQAQRGQSGY